MIKNTWPSLMRLDAFWKFFISHLSFHTAFHCYPALLFLFPQSSAFYPIMSPSSSKSGSVKQLSENPQPHAFETFCFSEDYEAFWRQVILPTICGSHDHQYIYYSNKPALPLLVSYAPSQPSIESVYKLILDTDINSPNCIPFPHYIDFPPRQSASIPIAWRLTAHGHFGPNILECFISDDNVAYQKGDIVALGPDAHRKVVMERVMEVGRYFILYEVKEVGSFPIGHISDHLAGRCGCAIPDTRYLGPYI
jgi:hypothetical protein